MFFNNYVYKFFVKKESTVIAFQFETAETDKIGSGFLLKKGQQKFVDIKWKFFHKKVIRKFGLRHFFRPPNSVPSLSPWVYQ